MSARHAKTLNFFISIRFLVELQRYFLERAEAGGELGNNEGRLDNIKRLQRYFNRLFIFSRHGIHP